MKKLDLTFENWWNGDIELRKLISTSIQLKRILINTNSILSFPEKEVEKIQLKQEELFNSIRDLTNRFIQDFNNRFTNAPSPADMYH